MKTKHKTREQCTTSCEVRCETCNWHKYHNVHKGLRNLICKKYNLGDGSKINPKKYLEHEMKRKPTKKEIYRFTIMYT